MSATRAEQALILADVASRRRLSPEEAALLRRRIRELADHTTPKEPAT